MLSHHTEQLPQTASCIFNHPHSERLLQSTFLRLPSRTERVIFHAVASRSRSCMFCSHPLVPADALHYAVSPCIKRLSILHRIVLQPVNCSNLPYRRIDMHCNDKIGESMHAIHMFAVGKSALNKISVTRGGQPARAH